MPSVRSSILAGSALALILSAAADATPVNSSAAPPAPAARDYSTPGSMPKPSSPLAQSDDRLRFRGPLPADGTAPRRDMTTPLAPASIEPPPAPPAVAPPRTAEPRRAPLIVPGPAIGESELVGKIRELIASKQFDRIIERKADRDAIAAFYKTQRDFRPLWVSGGLPSERAKDVADYLATIDADGLDPREYLLPRFTGDARGQAEAELQFTEAVLTYARHAMTGRVHFTRVSPNIEYKPGFDADDVLKKIVGSNDLPKTLDSFQPQHPAYQALKAKYAELRREPADSGPARIDNGPVLRYYRDRNGRETVMADPRVPRLRERLGLAAEPNSNYNAALATAVGKFQKANGIQPTGQLNTPTIEALNGPSRARQLDAVLATMERWRWMPRELGQTHVVLNIPDYHLRIYNNDRKVWQTRVVVGKPANQTPLLSETMKYITVNPTWNVPESIIYNELLPLYETSDPQIFERQGLKVERQSDGSVRVYQPPGEKNALGQIRFNFPNKYLVYQHDTPEKHYFAHDKRAYSHGCQRVQDPLKYAEVLLSYASPMGNYSAEGIRRMFGGKEHQIDFQNHIPVHITYQTAFVDEAGKLQFREDIYGHDAKMVAILRGSERTTADVAVERPADPNFKPTPAQGARLRSAAGSPNPFTVFQQLFR